MSQQQQQTTRRERSERSRSTNRRRIVLGVLIALIAVAALVAGLISVLDNADVLFGAENAGRQMYAGTLQTAGGDAAARAAAADAAADADALAGDAANNSADASATVSVEVPDLVGKTLAEARPLLEALGLAVDVRPGLAENAPVGAQEPAPRAVVTPGTAVTLAREGQLARTGLMTERTLRVLVALDGADGGAAGAAAAATGARTAALGGTAAAAVPAGTVVVIDPGHQSRGDSTHEPVGPGAKETKPRVTGGTSGVSTRIPEYEVVLQISTNLKRRLEAAGVTVIMTRTTNDVNISNSERAAIANEANAALFIRIHADGSTDSNTAGISTLYPGENRWTTPIAAPSKRAAAQVHEATVAATGATSRGTIQRTDLSGFNWATVPSVLVECGFMSNPVEDRLLSSPHYQDKLAQGMAAGILRYLDSTR